MVLGCPNDVVQCFVWFLIAWVSLEMTQIMEKFYGKNIKFEIKDEDPVIY